MIEDTLSSKLTDLGFRRINSNAEGIYLYYQLKNEEAYIISIIHTPNGDEFTQVQYKHILNQMKKSFLRYETLRVHLLSLIFTNNPEIAKQLVYEDEDNHWIIHLETKRLIIYETQVADFLGLRSEIEKLLIQDDLYNKQRNMDEYLSGQEATQRSPLRADKEIRSRWLTPVNTVIVAINVIVFILIRFTNLLGGVNDITAKGALSWIFVKEEGEYYRILTSMFMHSDWSHLVNNMLVLLFVGDNLERAAGKLRYLIIYIGSGVIAGITSISYNMVMNNIVYSIGASGAIFGIVGAMLYILITNKGRLEDISSRQILLFAIFSLYGGISNVKIDMAAHIGGFIAGLLLALIIYRRPNTAKEIPNAN